MTESEGYLHEKFAFYRRHGEWFEFNNHELRNVLRKYDRLENGDRGWFRLPSLPVLKLPSLALLSESDANVKGLAIAGWGAVDNGSICRL